MLYLEQKPSEPLSGHIRMLWYARAPVLVEGRERILPHGCVQVVLSLARDFLIDCTGPHPTRQPASLVVGTRSVYEVIDRSDMAELMGIVFRPDGFSRFAGDSVDRFSNRSIALTDLWGGRAEALRARLRETDRPEAKLAVLTAFLERNFTPYRTPHPMVRYALDRFRSPLAPSISDVAAATGWSQRRFSQVFREEVGVTPRTWRRIPRFQRAVRQLHTGAEVGWAELAQECGYYDQSHFANEFRAFSGIDVSTYSANRTCWANHSAA